MKRVENEILRQRYQQLHERDAISLNDVARALGWKRSKADPRPDCTRVARTLGLQNDCGHKAPRRTINYELACRLAEVLSLDPYEAGV